MPLLSTKIDTLIESDLQVLITNAVSEGKVIEYKRDLPGNTDTAKKEFLADVSSFANTVGGHLIYGINAESGVPTQLSGLSLTDVDAEILRLEQIIRTGLEPRVQGIAIQDISLANQEVALVIYIPRSWQPPHRIAFKNDGKFYARNSRGKYELDIAEIRSAFIQSETATERIKEFRATRLSLINAGDTPVSIQENAKTVLHFAPLHITEPLPSFDVASLTHQTQNTDTLNPIFSSGRNYRPNLDGFLVFSNDFRGVTQSYLQLFRTGAVETVTGGLFGADERSGYIPALEYERRIIEAVSNYIGLHRFLEIEPPVFVMVSFLNVKGFRMGMNSELMIAVPDQPYIDRDNLILPEVMIDNYDVDVPKALRPIFDAVWNSAGWQGSRNYDQQGNWKGK